MDFLVISGSGVGGDELQVPNPESLSFIGRLPGRGRGQPGHRDQAQRLRQVAHGCDEFNSAPQRQFEETYMLTQSYSDIDLEHLTTKARTIWEYDLKSTPQEIKRRANVIPDHVPLQAIYRMVVQDWAKAEFQRYHFPFSNNSFARVLGLGEGWNIPVEDRKYIEKDMVLFASDGRTILILPEQDRRWWETTWFNITSLAVGVVGLLFGFIK